MQASESFWDDVLAHLKQRVLIPIVGPELETVADGNRTVTVSRLLAERLAGRYKLAFEWTDRSDLDDVVRVLFAGEYRGESERFYRVVNDLLEEANAAPSEPLRQLAGILDIPLFVSTTFDSLLKRAIDEVRLDGPKTRELWFAPNQSTVEQQENASPPGPGVTTVFKLFGRASSTPQFALHEEDVLEWLHALLTEKARLPEWFSSQLKGSPLLFVGCRIPDWIGRFLVRMSSTERLTIPGKQVFIVGASVSREQQLATFLETYCGGTRVQLLEADPAEFISELSKRWIARNPPVRTAPVPEARGTIFISYVREDKDAARCMRDAIMELGGDVWLDERRLQPGDQWEDEILIAIRRQVQLFVPLISENTERRKESYAFVEWAEALKRAPGILSRRFIVPIVIDPDYDGNAMKYKLVQEDLRKFNFGRGPGGRPDEALRATLTAEIRAMRRKETA